MRFLSNSSSWPLRVAALAGILGIVAVQPSVTQEPARPIPPPPLLRVDSVAPSDEALRFHFAALRFDTAHTHADKQLLYSGRHPDSLVVGPLASIQPEVGLAILSEDQLREGRVVARIINHSSAAYPRLGLSARGVTYWWAQYDFARGVGRGVLISTDASGAVIGRVPVRLRLLPHTPRRLAPPLVRWILPAAGGGGPCWMSTPRGCLVCEPFGL